MNNRIFLTALLLVGIIGCGKSTAPPSKTGHGQVSDDVPQLTRTTLHITGFQKSKSGAT